MDKEEEKMMKQRITVVLVPVLWSTVFTDPKNAKRSNPR
jgi:hypothetical protein